MVIDQCKRVTLKLACKPGLNTALPPDGLLSPRLNTSPAERVTIASAAMTGQSAAYSREMHNAGPTSAR